jgi:hypothetical protein
MVDDHSRPDETNHKLAKEEERYRDEVNQGRHGAHKPCEKFPVEEAREQGDVAGTEMDEKQKAADNNPRR